MSKGMIAVNLKTGEEKWFASMVECAEYLDMRREYVSRCLRMNFVTKKGWCFRSDHTDSTWLTPQQVSVISAMAKCRLSPTKAGKELFTHTNNVLYHIHAIQKKTGLNARDFYDMVKLLEMVHRQ